MAVWAALAQWTVECVKGPCMCYDRVVDVFVLQGVLQADGWCGALVVEVVEDFLVKL